MDKQKPAWLSIKEVFYICLAAYGYSLGYLGFYLIIYPWEKLKISICLLS
jgi:hypothetical protein